MFEKVSRSLKYDSNIFFDHRHIYIYIYIYIYMDTTTDHFTPLALRVRGNELNDSTGWLLELFKLYIKTGKTHTKTSST